MIPDRCWAEKSKLTGRFGESSAGKCPLRTLTGVLEPLKDKAYFTRVRVDPDIGTVCWRNGADLDPDVLYAAVTGEATDVTEPEGILRE
jgi:hypothetical protein